MKKILLLLLTLFLVSCATQNSYIIPEEKFTNYPELSTSIESEIGSTLIYKEKSLTYPGLKNTENLTYNIELTNKQFKANESFINKTSTKKYHLYQNLNDTIYGIAVDKITKHAILYEKEGFYIVFYKSKKSIDYQELRIPEIQKKYFKQEFIYNGKVGTALKFIYREYSDNLARPAFTQDVQYDLSESNIIGFQGLRIEVITATNTKINYKVLSNFRDK